MKYISIEDSLVMKKLLQDAQESQKEVDANVQALVKEIGGDYHGIEHEIIDQAVLNDENLDWVIQEIKQWEQYRADLKI